MRTGRRPLLDEVKKRQGQVQTIKELRKELLKLQRAAR